jgi:hypothetical protein
VENGVNLSIQSIEQYLKAYDIQAASKKQFWKTVVAIVLSNIGTLLATALGLG